MDRPIEIVIADKSNLVLAGLRQLFGEDGRFRVVATVSDGAQFMQVVDDLTFDVGIVGWIMPQMGGREVLSALRERRVTMAAVVYTGMLDLDVPRQVMALGGAAFCSKREPPERLIEVAAAVAQGQMVFPRLDVRHLYRDPFDQLTAREMQLLAALADGASNGQIARSLGISPNTVKFHLKNLYEKLHVQNRTGAVALYVGNQARMR